MAGHEKALLTQAGSEVRRLASFGTGEFLGIATGNETLSWQLLQQCIGSGEPLLNTAKPN